MKNIVTYSGLALEKTTPYNNTIPTALGELAGRVTIGATIALGATLESLASSLLLLICLPASPFNQERLYRHCQYAYASARVILDAVKELFNQRTPSSAGQIKNAKALTSPEKRSTWQETVFSRRNLLLAGTIIAIVTVAVVAFYLKEKPSIPVPRPEKLVDPSVSDTSQNPPSIELPQPQSLSNETALSPPQESPEKIEIVQHIHSHMDSPSSGIGYDIYALSKIPITIIVFAHFAGFSF